jgi:hypothetical protein
MAVDCIGSSAYWSQGDPLGARKIVLSLCGASGMLYHRSELAWSRWHLNSGMVQICHFIGMLPEALVVVVAIGVLDV